MDTCIKAFEEKLGNVDVEALQMSPYAKRYLGHMLLHKKYYCKIYSHLLTHIISASGKVKENITLIDYGAGNGLLGLFAKFCGFKKVYIVDISPEFVAGCKALANALVIPLEEFITGDILTVQNYFGEHKPDAIVGTDVIEHIYNLDDFFTAIFKINSAMITGFTTASNPKNPYKVSLLKKLQIKDELYGGTPGDGLLYGEMAIEPFVKIRKDIITLYAPGISANDANDLAKLTRGKNKQDIEMAVNNFLNQHQLPILLPHPTNTCDPYTGSWTERLLTIDEYRKIYNKAGFTIKIYNGFYNEFDNTIKSFAMKIANWITQIMGITTVPFITIIGYKK